MTQKEFNQLPDMLQTKLKKVVLTKEPLEKLSMFGNMVMLYRADNVRSTVGCELCLDSYVEKDKDLWPMIGGRRLLGAEDMGVPTDTTDPVIYANLFACPNCRNLITVLLPTRNQVGKNIKIT